MTKKVKRQQPNSTTKRQQSLNIQTEQERRAGGTRSLRDGTLRNSTVACFIETLSSCGKKANIIMIATATTILLLPQMLFQLRLLLRICVQLQLAL